MAKCRIYFFTYKRNELLKRAIDSLLAQTFTDWVCEVHNDLPTDPFPSKFFSELNDERFTVINHDVNLGTTGSFNFAFNNCEEPYASMLEDDNWWEATFLEEMIKLMDENPSLNIAWSNMHTWKELPNNEWQNLNRTLWPINADRYFSWPQPQQALGCLHSTGAMIYRGPGSKKYQIPAVSLSNAVELIRERSFEHPIYLKSKPLANFSYTIVTSQSSNHTSWVGTQTMMLASYIINASNKKAEFKKLLQYYRVNSPSPVPVFLLAVNYYLKDRNLLLNFNLKDWIIVTKWCVKNAFKFSALRDYLDTQKPTWEFLKTHTRAIPETEVIK